MKILFLIRDKFGDSVVAACAAMDYARTHRQDPCTIIIRSAYACILRYEDNINVYPYISRPLAFLQAYWWRLTQQTFEVLCVLRGFGGQSTRFARAIPAKHKIVPDHLSINFAATVVEKTNRQCIYQPLLQYSVDLIHGFSPAYKNPEKLLLPGLVAQWKKTEKKYIAVCPLASELRREIPHHALIQLLESLTIKFPEQQIILLCRNAAERKMLLLDGQNLPIIQYGDIKKLMDYLLQSAAYYGVDSGHYHLAASMGMPCTVFFGPSEPSFVVLANQSNATAIRLPALGERFCPETTCSKPFCLNLAVSAYLSQPINQDNHPAYLPQCILR